MDTGIRGLSPARVREAGGFSIDTRASRRESAQDDVAFKSFVQQSQTYDSGAALLSKMVDEIKTRDSGKKYFVVHLNMKKDEHRELKRLLTTPISRRGAECLHGVCIRYHNHGSDIVVIGLNSHICDEKMQRAVQKLSMKKSKRSQTEKVSG